MSNEQIDVPVEDLKIGMYIARLDRPWLETPFLFQGFYIKTFDEIKELRRYCKFVYADLEKSRVSDQQKILIYKKRSSYARFLRFCSNTFAFCLNLFQAPLRIIQKLRPVDLKKQMQPIREELPTAEKAYHRASQKMSLIMQDVVNDKPLKLPEVRQNMGAIIDSLMRNSDAMVWLNRMKTKDNYSYTHSVSSAVWAITFGRHLNLPQPELETLGLGVMLMDIGKTKLPPSLLNKVDKFTPEQKATMQRHVMWSLEILKQTPDISEPILDIVASHHERHDGQGYPNGLKGHEIPVYGRIAGMVDSYDAMISQRQYGNPMSPLDAMSQLNKLADKDFQSEMIEKFIQAIGVFPNGTLVEFNTGDVGVVVAQNPSRRLRPKVMLILNPDKKAKGYCPLLDLSTMTDNSVWITKGLEPGAYGIEPSKYFLDLE